MNILRGVVALCICIIIGYVLSMKYRNKTLFYITFKDFNNQLKNEISFGKNSILQIIKTTKVSNEFYLIVKDYFENKLLNLNVNYLSQDDKNLLSVYLKNIGSGDSDSQLKYLENIGDEIDEKRLSSIEDEKKYKILYLKLSFFIGLILLVILL